MTINVATVPEHSRYTRDDVQKIADEMDAAVRESCSRISYDPTEFRIVNLGELIRAAARGGFHERYPFWKWAMEERKMKATLDYGFGRIYEMVRSGNPNVAFLLDFNEFIDQKAVIAHVYGHVHMFKNNKILAKQNKDMAFSMASNSEYIKEFYSRYGVNNVEKMIEASSSLEDLIDFYDYRREIAPGEKEDIIRKTRFYDPRLSVEDPIRYPAERDMDSFVNSPQYLEFQKGLMEEKKKKKRNPPEPLQDVLGYIMEYGTKLERWEREVIRIVREESQYFAPQMQTKILNEGAASYIETRLMAHMGFAGDDGIFNYAKSMAGVLGGSGANILNPYKVGLAILLDIEERWNKGRHGREYEDCDVLRRRQCWDDHSMKGEQKIFDVMEGYSDIQLIREFLTPDLMEKIHMFTYTKDETGQDRISDRAVDKMYTRVKKQLIMHLTNGGNPIITVKDGEFKGNHLYLHHQHFGFDLDREKLEETLKQAHKLWRFPVHLKTRFSDGMEELDTPQRGLALWETAEQGGDMYEGQCHRVSYDGQEMRTKNVCKKSGAKNTSECDCDDFEYDPDLRSPVPAWWWD